MGNDREAGLVAIPNDVLTFWRNAGPEKWFATRGHVMDGLKADADRLVEAGSLGEPLLGSGIAPERQDIIRYRDQSGLPIVPHELA